MKFDKARKTPKHFDVLTLVRMLAYAVYKSGGELEFGDEYDDFAGNYITTTTRSDEGNYELRASKASYWYPVEKED